MDNGVYTTLSRQVALFRDMAVTANNIANANTAGYGAQHIVFDSYLARDNNRGQPNKLALVNDVGTWRDTAPGPVAATGNPLDLAIGGDGYFAVETPLGTRYTRAGNFQTDANGMLMTAQGHAVLDNAGQHIEFPEDTVSIEIGGAGNIKVNGTDFGSVGVVRFENPQALEPVGSSLFKSEVEPQQIEDGRVAQGALEGSNVQPVVELTHMLNVSRSFTETSNMVAALYDLQRKTADTWAQQ